MSIKPRKQKAEREYMANLYCSKVAREIASAGQDILLRTGAALISEEIAATLKEFPQIGCLNRGGKPVYYAYIAGKYHERKRIKRLAAKIQESLNG